MITSLFGTDGIRGTVGQFPLTTIDLIKLGHAIAQWAQQRYSLMPRILIGMDTRISCAYIKAALKTGLLTYPVKLFDAGIVPTPTLGQLAHYNNEFDCGIIISASHNPYQDNGIKLFDASSGKLQEADELHITELYASRTTENHSYTTFGTDTPYLKATDDYIATLTKFFPPYFLQSISIALDCAHGAASELAPAVFTHFGAQVIPLYCQPNGININKACGAVHPQQLQQAVLTHHADIGFAFDGDGDRVIAVNKFAQIKHGDHILALLATHPRYRTTKTIVGTIMTNQGFEAHLNKLGKTLIRTNVGDRWVSQALAQHKLMLGGEPSGHIIAHDYLPTGDGIFIALLIAQTMLMTENSDLTSFVQFPQILINVPVHMRQDLSQPILHNLITEHHNKLREGRLVVRYSGTEPLLRIMVEDIDADHAQAIGSSLAQQLKQQLS